MFKKNKLENTKAYSYEEIQQRKGKQKRFFFRRIAKDIKRVRWPSASTNWKNFIKILIFTIIFVLFVYAISIGFQSLWSQIGIATGN
ncbi:preprotein translocase subunit SecE [Mycoplasma buteonis]|uniref:preprotein translocase subunit SecE n=1 Tax=Mycoplasma buteonis TaxID=171280 RepID=UPI00068DC5E1|nr:preprotein translocase subunit SecE [Mycoplasma buteonis]